MDCCVAVRVGQRQSFLSWCALCSSVLTQFLPVRVCNTRIMTDTQKKKKKPWLAKADKAEKSDTIEKLQTKSEKSPTKSEKHYSKSEKNQVK